ncbi:MAG: hypothetical protein D6741_14440 [Planctomycetota bacterium]|nr:MAG: hypothetical protein D6741_14440 [Planctomycetota bacterium]
MRESIIRWLAATAIVAGAWCMSVAEGRAQEPAADETQPSVSQSQLLGPPRKLAPGVLTVIKPELEYDETHDTHPIVELTTLDPSFTFAQNADFRRDIWGLEFAFKPVRMIYVDLPQPSGLMQRKLIWYMVYRVTNNMKVLHPVPQPDGGYTIEEIEKPIRFVPHFVLESDEVNKRYPDRIIPLAAMAIQQREDPNIRFYNTAEMARVIQPGETLWGVVTWEDVDPTIDRFSIYVSGLTNAYRWTDPPGAYKVGDPIGQGRQFTRKELKLNFWRPGDDLYEHEEEIRFGRPDQVDYEWIYR